MTWEDLQAELKMLLWRIDFCSCLLSYKWYNVYTCMCSGQIEENLTIKTTGHTLVYVDDILGNECNNSLLINVIML